MSHATFARGGGAKAAPKASGKASKPGVVEAVVNAVAGNAAGSAMNGTVNGKRGFQKGNTYASKAHRNPAVAAAKSNHTAKARSARSHVKAGTALSKAGRAAIRDAAAAHRELQATRATHAEAARVAKNEARRTARAAGKAPTLEQFAGRVHEAVATAKTGHFGDAVTGHQVFISHVKSHLARDPHIGKMSDDQFKARLLEAHKARHLELGRADLVEAMDVRDVRASKTPHMGAEYHFVKQGHPPAHPLVDRVRAGAAEASGVKAKAATAYLHNLQLGGHDAASAHTHVNRIARGTTKDELFAAARAAGIEHGARTKKDLVEHLKRHVAAIGGKS